MEHIARRADMTRQNLYRYVSGRSELVELAILERSRELAAQVAEQTDHAERDVADEMVDTILDVVWRARADREFGYLTEATPRVALNVLVASRTSAMHSNVHRLLDPLLRRAHMEGRLRSDVTEDELVEWLQGVLTLLAPRPDLDRAAMDRMIRAFVLPIVLKNPDH